MSKSNYWMIFLNVCNFQTILLKLSNIVTVSNYVSISNIYKTHNNLLKQEHDIFVLLIFIVIKLTKLYTY